MNHRIWVLMLIGVLLLPAAAGTGIDATWANLRSLAGEWEGSFGALKGGITYAILSGGSVVMESMKMPPPAPDMVTMYHRDGTGLVATHYCSMGNQPRMRASVASPDGKTVQFRFADITNLAKPDGAHIRHLKVTFLDAGHFTQDWTSIDKGKEQTEVFKWKRKK